MVSQKISQEIPTSIEALLCDVVIGASRQLLYRRNAAATHDAALSLAMQVAYDDEGYVRNSGDNPNDDKAMHELHCRCGLY